jgi:diketogulonate reductase-like aldo/keto reductase
MRIAGDNTPADKTKGKLALRAAIEAGYNHFDQAIFMVMVIVKRYLENF